MAGNMKLNPKALAYAIGGVWAKTIRLALNRHGSSWGSTSFLKTSILPRFIRIMDSAIEDEEVAIFNDSFPSLTIYIHCGRILSEGSLRRISARILLLGCAEWPM